MRSSFLDMPLLRITQHHARTSLSAMSYHSANYGTRVPSIRRVQHHWPLFIEI